MKGILSTVCAFALVGAALTSGAEAGDKTSGYKGDADHRSGTQYKADGDYKKGDRTYEGDRDRDRSGRDWKGNGSASPRTGDDGRRDRHGDARPMSMDDCKDGGYAKYGFENQGQCVSSVTPGKQ